MKNNTFSWLRLYGGFFETPQIIRLRRMGGGDKNVVLYQRMQLLALNNEGVLTFLQIEEDFPSEIASVLCEPEDDVRTAISNMEKCKLIECYGGMFILFPDVIKNTGTEAEAKDRLKTVRDEIKRRLNAAAAGEDEDITASFSKGADIYKDKYPNQDGRERILNINNNTLNRDEKRCQNREIERGGVGEEGKEEGGLPTSDKRSFLSKPEQKPYRDIINNSYGSR